MALGELIKAGCIGIEQRGHLVDERARATCARAVHALLDAVVEVDDLRILATELDGDIGLRDEGLNSGFAGDDLLHEIEIEPLRQKQAARTRDRDGHDLVAVLFRSTLQHFDDRCAHIRMMALIHRIHDLVRVVQNGKLDRGRTHVDTDVQIGLSR